MQEVFEKIIKKLEEESDYEPIDYDCCDVARSDEQCFIATDKAIEIVSQAASEYSNVMIDGKYCFQTCACTEQCYKCSRLCNGDTDWYENIDNWAEEFATDTNVRSNGWIPCSERLPEEHDSMFARFKGTDKWRDSMFEKTSNEVTVTIADEKGEKATTHAHTTDGTWKCDILRACPAYRVIIAWQIKRGCFRQIKTMRQEASGKHHVTLLSVYSAHWKKQQTTHAD